MGNTHTKPAIPKHCVFCNIEAECTTKILHQDETLIAFVDRSPGAEAHFLIIPRSHIPTVSELTANDIPLLENMTELGLKLLKENGILNIPEKHSPHTDTTPPNYHLGFHIPPFNSIKHLHLHVLGGKFEFGQKWRYSGYRKVFWKDVDCVVNELRDTK